MTINWEPLTIEVYIIFNMLLFMVFLSFVVQVVARQLSVTISFVWQQYFESKKKYLQELSKLEVPDDLRSKFN